MSDHVTSTSNKRLVKSKSGLRFVPISDTNRSPFELREPAWTPDKDSPECSGCGHKFDFLTRRHHCRRCGLIFCRSCCDERVPLPRMCFVDPVRLCTSCTVMTKKENDFFDKYLKTLHSGAHFQILAGEETRSPVIEGTNNERGLFFCTLSPDHRLIRFEGNNEAKQEAINLNRITEVEILRAADKLQGAVVADGIVLKYRPPGVTDEKEVVLLASSAADKKQAMAWIAALQKAMKIVYESKQPQQD